MIDSVVVKNRQFSFDNEVSDSMIVSVSCVEYVEAKEKNLSGIVWQVLEWNEPAINFYKKYNASFDGEWLNCSLPVWVGG